MPSPLFFGQAGGPQIFSYQHGTTNLGNAYQPILRTWDVLPAGETGTVYFRGILCSLITVNGATLTVTPYLDDVPLQPQVFQQIGSGDYAVVAQLANRGRRLSCLLTITNFGGGVDVCNLRAAFEPVRSFP